ncbi:MAG TPA: DUF5985 family protein [Gemmatimonadaceae bacterium]|nr:DUF5985 family protein [Gemmatimonadaceae bacterium]
MRLFVSGLLVMGYAVIALFFARFWRESHDRLFGWFATAFALMAVQRAGLALAMMSQSPTTTGYYVLRLVAFVLILAGIADKNRHPAG